MANEQKVPTTGTFMVPEGEIQLITWQFVLDKLEDELGDTLTKMSINNQHLDNIAGIIEGWIPDESE